MLPRLTKNALNKKKMKIFLCRYEIEYINIFAIKYKLHLIRIAETKYQKNYAMLIICHVKNCKCDKINT